MRKYVVLLIAAGIIFACGCGKETMPKSVPTETTAEHREPEMSSGGTNAEMPNANTEEQAEISDDKRTEAQINGNAEEQAEVNTQAQTVELSGQDFYPAKHLDATQRNFLCASGTEKEGKPPCLKWKWGRICCKTADRHSGRLEYSWHCIRQGRTQLYPAAESMERGRHAFCHQGIRWEQSDK